LTATAFVAGTAVAMAVVSAGADPAFVEKPGPPLGNRFEDRFPMSAGENPCDTGTTGCPLGPLGGLGVFGATVGQREKANTKNISQFTAKLIKKAFHKMPMEETPKNP
jgi:hypothetical protein